MDRSQPVAGRPGKTGEEDWRALVRDTLRGAGMNEITRRTDDGIAIGPIDAAATVPFSLTRPSGSPWKVIQPVDHPDAEGAGARIAEEIAGGADGVSLVMAGSAAAERSGFGMERLGLPADFTAIAGAHVRLEVGAADYLSAYRRLRGHAATLGIAFDPLAVAAADGGFDRPLAGLEDAIADIARSMESERQNGFAIIADGRVWAAAGASEAQELGAVLGSLLYEISVLTRAGIAKETAARRIGVTLDAGPHHIVTVAKIRAARLLHARLAEALGIEPCPVELHAETSWRMMTRTDAHTNIVRATSAALAAGVGGADSISVVPWTQALGLADGGARRVARNIQIILRDEARMAQIIDPASGSGTIERLTEALAERAWEVFRVNEVRGGLLAALRSGAFQTDITQMQQRRTAPAAQGPRATGEADIRVLARRPPAPARAVPQIESFPALKARRLSEPFEEAPEG